MAKMYLVSKYGFPNLSNKHRITEGDSTFVVIAESPDLAAKKLMNSCVYGDVIYVWEIKIPHDRFYFHSVLSRSSMETEVQDAVLKIKGQE